MIGAVDSLFNVIVASRVMQDSVLIKQGFGFAFLFHDRVHTEQGEVCLREIFSITHSRFLPAKRATDD